MKRTHPLLHWTARFLSLVVGGFLLLFMVGEGFNPARLTPRELVLSGFFPFGLLLGLALAWRWERLGGALAVLSIAAFYGVHWLGSGRFPNGVFFALTASPGFLFLLAGLTMNRKAPTANP